MSHHSSDDPLRNEAMKELLKLQHPQRVRESMLTTAAFGPTDEFPDGKMAPNDEGGIRFGVARDGDKVLVDFGTPVHSLGMTKEQACELGRLLITKAGFTCRIGFGG